MALTSALAVPSLGADAAGATPSAPASVEATSGSAADSRPRPGWIALLGSIAFVLALGRRQVTQRDSG